MSETEIYISSFRALLCIQEVALHQSRGRSIDNGPLKVDKYAITGGIYDGANIGMGAE